ncbi:MAG: M3 family metallopeptidase [Flavobacteriaceae bacterium]|nr:M3 family metallopeptidase [Flavobacteriaceae bacterium]
MKKLHYLILAFAVTLVACDGEKNNDSMKENFADNPILSEWDTPFGVPPFDLIKAAHYRPAFEVAFKENKEEIDAIIAQKEAPTFENTILEIERAGKTLGRVSRIFSAVNAANSDKEIRTIASEMAPVMAKHSDYINLNPALFKRVAVVYNNREAGALNAEESKLLEETYKGFIRSGVNLKGAENTRLRAINSEMASLAEKFGKNVLEETNKFELFIDTKKDLGNLPSSLTAIAANEAKARGHENGWSITLQRPSINPFLQASTNATLRQKMYDGYASRGNNDNEFDNKKILEKLVSLRVERAQLLGFKSHAEFKLSNAMAENPANVYDFLDKLWPAAIKMAEKEAIALQAYKNKEIEGLPEYKNSAVADKTLTGGDWRHYVEKVRKERYAFNEDEMRPYFECGAVMQGAFTVATKLFGITFKELKDMPKWHKDQQVFEVLEADGTHIGIIYMDMFARESKRGGAWMNSLRAQSKLDGDVSPIVTNNCNFPPPTDGEPSLLSFSQAQTLFHEFGHGLHGLLSDVTFGSLSGTNVPRDFVEFPSQVMENWMSDPEVLKLYAKHYKTGEVIPDALVEKMNKANQFNAGFRTVEYMAAAYLDMAFHSLKEVGAVDADAFEKAEMERIGLIEQIIPRYRATYFNHVFSGGYSSGYYSYLWSEVLDSDGFEAFKETSIFDKETAAKLRRVFSQGGTKPGMELYKEFRGRAPKMEPLMRKKGFMK